MARRGATSQLARPVGILGVRQPLQRLWWGARGGRTLPTAAGHNTSHCSYEAHVRRWPAQRAAVRLSGYRKALSCDTEGPFATGSSDHAVSARLNRADSQARAPHPGLFVHKDRGPVRFANATDLMHTSESVRVSHRLAGTEHSLPVLIVPVMVDQSNYGRPRRNFRDCNAVSLSEAARTFCAAYWPLFLSTKKRSSWCSRDADPSSLPPPVTACKRVGVGLELSICSSTEENEPRF
jgi:hypothetical protein